jgi:hypothetical protein
MSSTESRPETPEEASLPPVRLDPLAAFLSYLIPGLGQVYQGRVGKGLLFFFGLYLLFFYGMWMGQWRNVWLPETDELPPVVVLGHKLEGPLKAVWYRPQFLGQFWIGTAAWPAIYQYIKYDHTKEEGPLFGKFQRAPTEDQLNDLQRNGSKRWDLGWVYTVIAGVLNLLVIYDALAGPMFRDPPRWMEEEGAEEGASPPSAPKPSNPAPSPPAQPAPSVSPVSPVQSASVAAPPAAQSQAANTQTNEQQGGTL